jgi:hypothetical protein
MLNLDEKKEVYTQKREILRTYLNELVQILDSVEDNPLQGEERKLFMEKFSMVDHRLMDRFDTASQEYHQAIEEN